MRTPRTATFGIYLDRWGLSMSVCRPAAPRWVLMAALIAGLPAAVPASASGQGLWPVSLEGSWGVGAGWAAGEYADPTQSPQLTMDVTAAVRVRSTPGGSYIAGLSLSGQGGASEDRCRVAPGRPNCLPNFPDFMIISALAGWENSRASFRLATGPSYLQHVSRDALGWQARWDGVAPIVGHLGVGASLRVVLVPDYRGDPLALLGFGLGIRVH